ncbi:hypothetical protein QQ045_002113 [Rhodiola kirilowii]
MPGPAGEERSLEDTATWAVALVCAVFVMASFILEHRLDSLAKFVYVVSGSKNATRKQ